MIFLVSLLFEICILTRLKLPILAKVVNYFDTYGVMKIRAIPNPDLIRSEFADFQIKVSDKFGTKCF